jgi:hypothetical protein
MQITYTPPNPIDTMMPYDFRKLEKSLPATPYEVQEKNLLWMVEHEYDNPEYFGPRIRELSDRLGC